MNEKNGMRILLIFVGLALVVVSAFALITQVELREARKSVAVYNAMVSEYYDKDFKREQVMMDRPGIITNVDYITGKDADNDEVYIYTYFPWGTVKGKCSKEFFENVHNFPKNREQIMKHLRPDDKVVKDRKSGQQYNTFNYEVYLSDYMSLWITVDYQKDYVISEEQKNLLRYVHKRIVSSISGKEWEQCGEEQ